MIVKLLLLKDSVTIKDLDGNVQDRDTYTAQIDASDAEKGIYDHYMLKEINEQPAVMRRIIQEYEDEKGDLKLIVKLLKMLQLQIVYISSQQEQVIMQV